MDFLKKTFLGVLAGLLIFSGASFAKEFRGKILSLKADAYFLAVQVLDASDKPGEAMVLRGSKDTRLTGIASFEELSVGDIIQFEAEEALIGGWKLNAVSKDVPKEIPQAVQPETAPVAPAEKKPETPAPAKPAVQVSSSAGGAAMAMGGYVGD